MTALVNSPNGYTAFDCADLLTSGLTGKELVEALRANFSGIGRGDLFLAIRIAVSIWSAEHLEVRAERDTLRLDLDSAQIELGWLRRQVECMRDSGAWLRPAPSVERAAHG